MLQKPLDEKYIQSIYDYINEQLTLEAVLKDIDDPSMVPTKDVTNDERERGRRKSTSELWDIFVFGTLNINDPGLSETEVKRANKFLNDFVKANNYGEDILTKKFDNLSDDIKNNFKKFLQSGLSIPSEIRTGGQVGVLSDVEKKRSTFEPQLEKDLIIRLNKELTDKNIPDSIGNEILNTTEQYIKDSIKTLKKQDEEINLQLEKETDENIKLKLINKLQEIKNNSILVFYSGKEAWEYLYDFLKMKYKSELPVIKKQLIEEYNFKDGKIPVKVIYNVLIDKIKGTEQEKTKPESK